MIRYALLAVPVVALLACSSSSSEPSCQIAGTYTMTATPETKTSGCDAIANGPQTSTVTITARPPGMTGPDFAIELQGAQGACAGTLVEACKVQSKCDYNLTDAVDPKNSTGTVQFSWTFDATGFSGLNAGTFPAAKSVPGGCTFSSNATAKRR